LQEFPVFWDGQACGTIPFAMLPALRLFCEENGIAFRWETEPSRVDLRSGLAGNICVLIWGDHPSATADAQQLEREMLLQLQQFLVHAGIGVVFSSSASVAPLAQFAVQITARLDESTAEPHALLYTNERDRRRSLVDVLERELKQADLLTRVESRPSGAALSVTEIACCLPASMPPTARKQFAQTCVLAVASGLIRFFLQEARVSIWACLKPALMNWLTGSSAPAPPAAKTAGERTASTDGHAAPARQPGTWAAEVFFDYTVIRSELEHQPLIVRGNLYIKNTGQAILTNPVICLRIDPPDNAQLSGQMLPAHMVETLGIQGADGVKGWRLLKPEELAQEKRPGEHWIAPVHPVHIAPHTVFPFQNFQLSVRTTGHGRGGYVTVEGAVFFANRNC